MPDDARPAYCSLISWRVTDPYSRIVSIAQRNDSIGIRRSSSFIDDETFVGSLGNRRSGHGVCDVMRRRDQDVLWERCTAKELLQLDSELTAITGVIEDHEDVDGAQERFQRRP